MMFQESALFPWLDVLGNVLFGLKLKPKLNNKERKDVAVDDVARILVNFGRGCGGTIEANWVATGRKMHLGFEISGEKGSLVFSQERLNELLFYRAGHPEALVAKEAAQGQVCQAANDNGGGQVVVSGNKAAVERAVEIAKGKGAKRAMMLQVSAPFHCALMKPAADAMAEALGKASVKSPAVPVVANVVASPISDPQEIVRRLVEQVTGTVRWRECASYMAAQGVKTFYEVGAGKVLTGLLKRIADGATGSAIGTPEDIAAFKAARGK